MEDPKKRLEEMVKTLKDGDYRITPQRLAILKILAGSTAHPSVEAIYEEVKGDFPTTSLATVYKTLVLMKDLNQVMEISIGDGSNRYDGNQPFPHPHLICVKCKKIIDFEPDPLDSVVIKVAKKTGYKIISHRLDFFGICPDCQAESELNAA